MFTREQKFNSTDCYFPFHEEEVEGTIPERFVRVVTQFSDRVAVKTSSQRLTYRELDKMSSQLAQVILSQRGEGAEPVALFLEHGIASVVAILGVLKAGKYYVALDPSHRHARLVDILEDVQTKVIVTSQEHISFVTELARNKCHVINIDELETRFSSEKVNVSITPDALAAIFYTSGSTGKPEGVMRDHRSILHPAWRNANDYHIRIEDHLSLLSFSGFSGSVTSIFGALLNGAAVYPYNAQRARLDQLVNWLIQEEITIFQPPMMLFRQLLDTLTGKEHFPKLRLVNLGGQVLYKQDVERFKRYFPTTCILLYRLASTEAGGLTQLFIDRQTEIHGNLVPVGYAVEDKEILVLNEWGQHVEFDQVGEIAVRSRYLASGYWRKPGLTRQKFLPDPEGGDQRIYLTGDLGRMRPGGCLEYLGRKDFMVKIRGYRVGLTEVEAGLYNSGLVKDVVVVAKDAPNGEARLVAYLVPVTHPAPTVSELRRRVADTLPDYMMPSAFVMLENLPLTSTGKVDRQALPEPTWTRPVLEVACVSPRDPVELQLTRIWEQVLAMQSIGIHDNFFELGGDSILALRLVAEIERVLGHTLPLPTLLQAPTIAQLAEVLRQKGWTPPWSSLVAIQPDGSNPPFFCVPPAAVTALFFVNLTRHLGSDQPFYGLQPLGLDQDEVTPHGRVEDMAAHYLQEIRQLQPEGPYYLGGMCFGGVVAFEMAQQLMAQGQPIALLAILDTRLPPGMTSYQPFQSPLLQHYWQRGWQAWQEGEFWQLGGRKLKHWLRRYGKHKQLAKVWRRVVSPVKASIERFHPQDMMAIAQKHRIQRVEQAHQEARRGYRPRVYPGKITFFWSRDTRRGLREEWARWSTEALEVHICPGRHNTMLREPHVRVVAEKLRACIEQAQASAISQAQTSSCLQRDFPPI